jgi:hypothetical protein
MSNAFERKKSTLDQKENQNKNLQTKYSIFLSLQYKYILILKHFNKAESTNTCTLTSTNLKTTDFKNSFLVKEKIKSMNLVYLKY